MKTSELKKIVEDNEFYFTKGTENIYVDTILGWFISIDKENSISINEQRSLRTPRARDVMKALIEYAETPIEEREEEKKYYIKMIDFFGDFNYLNHSKTKVAFAIGGKLESQSWKTQFTDKQISEMPSEIQKAIECGFLKKVEVE